MVTKDTATAIAYAYREIEIAAGLLDKITDALRDRAAPDVRDAFGRLREGLQLGVPSGDSSRRLFDVPWRLARPIIEAHIAHHKSIISVLSEKARIECDSPTPAGD